MQTNVSADNQFIDHPIDLIETLAASREWPRRGARSPLPVASRGRGWRAVTSHVRAAPPELRRAA